MNGRLFIIVLIQVGLHIISGLLRATAQSSNMDKTNCIPDDAYGVQRQIWTNLNIGFLSTLKKDPRYPDKPTKIDYVTTLEAPRRRDENYGQTLTTYFFPPETGKYVFYMACDDECELLISGDTDPQNARVVIVVNSFTNYRHWDGDPKQSSPAIHLVQGHLYYINAIMAQIGGDEHLSIGVKLPSGEYVRPLTNKYLLRYPLKVGVENLTLLASWGKWSQCTVTCGGGIQIRSRVCLNSSVVSQLKRSTIKQIEERVCDQMKPCPTPPRQIKVKMVDSWSIRVTWQPFVFNWSTGILMGHELTFKSLTISKPKKRIRRNTPTQEPDRTFSHVVSGSSDFGHVIIPASFQAIMLTGLHPFTEYCIQMTTVTTYWKSTPSACVNVTTAEFIPSLPPANVTALNLTGSNKILVKWAAIPIEHQNGRILGYEITIRRVASSKNEKPEAWTMADTSLDMKTMVTGLAPSSLYIIRVAAFTAIGPGPLSKPVYASTCRCPKTLYTNWWPLSPLAKATAGRGIFPSLLRNVIDSACGNCRDHQRTFIDFHNGKLNRTAMKSDISEVKKSMTSAHVSFPIWIEKGKQLSGDNFQFVPVIEVSGGVVYINRKLTPDVYAKMLGSSVFQCWPIFVLITVLCWLAGTILCILEIISFPLRTCYRSSFMKGVYEYTWCAFTSMTTVGYGDRYPRSVQGRIFMIIWFIIGCILASLFVSTLASSLCVQIVVITKNPVQGGKVGVLEMTPEYKIAMTINGTKGIHCIQYNNMAVMLKDLHDNMIDGILLDALSSSNLNESVLPPSWFQVAKTFELVLDYGIVLSGDALKLDHVITEYIKNNPVSMQKDDKNNNNVSQAIREDNISETPTDPSSTKSIEEEEQINFFDPSNNLYSMILHFSSGFLIGAAICGLFFHCLKTRQNLMQSRKDIRVKYQYLRTLDTMSLQRHELKSFYLRILLLTNELRIKHHKQQQYLLKQLRKKNSSSYQQIPIKCASDVNENFSQKNKPVIIHHREFVENKETSI